MRQNYKKKTIMCTHIVKALDNRHGLPSKPSIKERKEHQDDYFENECISIDKIKGKTRNNRESKTYNVSPSGNRRSKKEINRTKCRHSYHEPVKLFEKIG